MEWQPIETAPKDAEILLFVDVAIGPMLIVQGCWYRDENEHGWIDSNGDIYRATHWMPLPPAPESK